MASRPPPPKKNVGHITYEGKRKLYLLVYLANKYGRVNLGRGREETKKVFRGRGDEIKK